MKYTATIITETKEHDITFSVRSDARVKTVFEKTIRECAAYMRENGIAAGDICYTAQLPNIWKNGGVGFISIDNKVVVLYREDGCLFAD